MKHNSLLCFQNQNGNSIPLVTVDSNEIYSTQPLNADAKIFKMTNNQEQCLIARTVNSVNRACLPTAKVLIKKINGNFVEVITLLDSTGVAIELKDSAFRN